MHHFKNKFLLLGRAKTSSASFDIKVLDSESYTKQLSKL